MYVGEHNGAKEYRFPGDRFAEVAGGPSEASALKKDVASRGPLVTTRRGRQGELRGQAAPAGWQPAVLCRHPAPREEVTRAR